MNPIFATLAIWAIGWGAVVGVMRITPKRGAGAKIGQMVVPLLFGATLLALWQ